MELNLWVAYAEAEKQWLVPVKAPAGMTLQGAVEASGLLMICPQLAGEPLCLGVFGKRRESGDLAQDGDRIEIYRPLLTDPKTARRERARKPRGASRQS